MIDAVMMLAGEAWGDWSLYTDSPLRAFEGELGVQAPVGFWDPLGLSADGGSADASVTFPVLARCWMVMV